MKALVRYSRGRTEYTGRVDRAAFAAWADSPDGRAVVGRLASEMGFALFGKTRAARRRLWRELTAASRSESCIAALQSTIDRALGYLDTLVHARALPRLGVDLHRLIAVPRLFVNAAMARRMDVLLDKEPIFASANGRQSLRDWFSLTVVRSAEAAIAQARPSPSVPLPAGEGWIIVGIDEGFEWHVPFHEPAWPGHYYLLELTRAPITRGVRKHAAQAIDRLAASLPSLSRLQRQEILRQARLSLDEILRDERVSRAATAGLASG